ncbi:MAG: ATP-dependent zinc metalloprotease FtsH [Clostridia bacterium]|nr:ATP-dependent zinc metalloprotease FtsH [Clostridia bacterium]
MNKKNTKRLIFYAVVAVFVVILAYMTLMPLTANNYDSLDQLISDIKAERVVEFSINDNGKCTVKLKDELNPSTGEVIKGESKIYEFTSLGYSFFTEHYGELLKEQFDKGTITLLEFDPPSSASTWLSYIPYLLLGALIIFTIIAFMRTSGKGGALNNFGKARTKVGSDEKKKVLFRDVAGADEEKEELKEVVDFLRDPGKYTKLGAKIPHGVLLVGPPGTGKTLLAKAVAGEAGVPFFSISGSDFVEMYVGVGASRVRDLFDNAKKYPASIVFIDEIDAVGRHRGAGLGGGHDEREQTLNQLLVEMDGFGSGNAVIVIAATNRPDILDPALLRPGRFDRQITVGYPDIKGRLEILKIHAQGKPFENEVSLEKVAKTTVGFTGADLANLLNEAALLAARRNKHLIGEQELEDASIKVMVGTEKRSRVVKDKEKKLTAYHEAGHAILTKLLQPDNQVHQISVIPTGSAGGYTIHRPNEDRSYNSKNEMKNDIVVLLGGRMAEKLVLEDISTGASNDIQRATSIARSMVTRYGFSDILGPVVYGSEHGSDEVFLGRDFNNQKNYSDATASIIDQEIKRIVCEAYELAEKLLTENMDKLHFIAEYLFKNEIMDEYQFEAVMSGEATTVAQLEELSESRKQRSKEENEAKAKRDEAERIRREEEERRLRNLVGGNQSQLYRTPGDDPNNRGGQQ